MAYLKTNITTIDPLWDQINDEARQAVVEEPLIGGFVHACILHHKSIEKALSYRIAAKLASNEMSMVVVREVVEEAYQKSPELVDAARSDLVAVYERDPACHRLVQPILYFKGFHAIQTHRLAHWAWNAGRRDFALYLQSRSSDVFQTDINPQAKFGRGIFIDHATGIVVGATAVIGDDVSILQGVTLGGTGKESGDRHPKVKNV